jgi:hypothetical protein
MQKCGVDLVSVGKWKRKETKVKIAILPELQMKI